MLMVESKNKIKYWKSDVITWRQLFKRGKLFLLLGIILTNFYKTSDICFRLKRTNSIQTHWFIHICWFQSVQRYLCTPWNKEYCPPFSLRGLATGVADWWCWIQEEFRRKSRKRHSVLLKSSPQRVRCISQEEFNHPRFLHLSICKKREHTIKWIKKA